MRCFAASFVIALLAGTAASCSGDDGRSDTGAEPCAPGQQVSCPCPGGELEGVQICDPSGAGFGVCMGCGEDESSGGVTTVDDDATTDTTGTPPTDSTGPTVDEGDSTGAQGESETSADMFVWAWVDHGGPPYLPPPCAAAVGVADGLLVDPQAFFMSLVAGTDADDWEAVMNAIEPDLWACGLGQQRGSQGNVRGRLFLPTEACPNAAPPPDDPMAMFLGVRQEEACWAHFVDVLADA